MSTSPSQQKAGAQISRKAFLQSVGILLVLMLIAGILTRILPPGSYQREVRAGRAYIVPGSYTSTPAPDYPVWRWFTAPLEVLGSEDGLVVVVIILFILMVGGAFAVLDYSGILKAGIAAIVRLAGGHKYRLLLGISFFFMALGAFFGIFEEVVPLVPLMLALAYYLGWDSLVGLGMSVLATNMGFSAAVTNPFTIGVAQEIAGLPLFSGAWLRLIIFAVMYVVLALFLVRYARRIERQPQSSLVYTADEKLRQHFTATRLDLQVENPRLRGALVWFGGCALLMVALLVSAPFVPLISDFAMPLVGLLFLAGGVGAGLLAIPDRRAVWRALGQGVGGMAPGIVLILMAVSIKHIIVSGGVMDTLLYYATGTLGNTSPLASAWLMYFLALLLELFVASGSAKAFLMLPILIPLADLVGVTRQVTVTAYCFGDGFTNLMYPTNPVLLIVLGLTPVTFLQWLKWSLKLWLWVMLVALAFLALGVWIGYGPF